MLKPQSNGPLYNNTMTGTLIVDGWAVTFGTARMGPCSDFMDMLRRLISCRIIIIIIIMGLGGLRPAQSPPRCTKCNSPPIKGLQYTNFTSCDVAL